MCGIFGVYNNPEAANLTYLGLYALQHRGQESVGIASCDGKTMYPEIHMGRVADVFHKGRLLRLKGHNAIGHVRYSTTGVSRVKNAQPLVINYINGNLAMGHNGNLVNATDCRTRLEKDGSIFQTTSDTEVILHLIARENDKPIEQAIISALNKVTGAYSFVLLQDDKLIAVRDPWGIRPLCIGKLGKGYIVASESCALDLIGAQYIREIDPGEMLVFSKKGMKSIKFGKKDDNQAKCIFEYIYFSRPDSIIFNKSVHSIRRELGRQLARESFSKIKKADLVMAVPDSANSAAMGYAQESGISYESGLIRNHYIGRTFIEPGQHIRDFGAKIKYNPVKELLKGKNVIVVDDSIVRGTTSRKLVKMIKNAGAKKVHLVISSPPITDPCYYGIDTPTKKELIGANKSVEQIRKFLDVDTLHYLSIEGLLNAAGSPHSEFCTACFNGNYKIGKETGKSK